MPVISNSTRPIRLGALNAASETLVVRDERVLVEFANDRSFVGTVAIQRRNPAGTNVWFTVTINGADAVFTNCNVLERFVEEVTGAEWRLIVTNWISGSGVAAIMQ